jgi:hypothetical protein
LITLLVVALLIASTIAVVEYVQLRAANERIEELESGSGSSDGGGGPFGDFGELVEDLLGETEGLFEGAGEIGSLFECLGSPFTGGEAGKTVEEIASQVEGLRELEFTRDVEPEFLNDQQMTERVQEVFLEEYPTRIADVEQRLLAALGAIPRGTDLRQLRTDAIGQQVAGFYEPETGELVVRQSGAEVSAIDRITLAHELDHALTDQVLGIPLPDDPEVGQEDANLAALALVEGDATAVMQRYSATLGFDEQFDLLDPEAIAQAEAGLSGFPPYLEQELVFPYEEGLSFVCDLYAEGGWDAVNRAYEHPPASTDQVLFPERYREGEQPVEPPDTRAPGKGWAEDATVQMGAANLLWLFSAPGGDRSRALEDPRSAAGEWAGGRVQLWTRGSESAVGIALVQRPGSEGLCSSVREWYRESFDDDDPAPMPGTVEMAMDGPQQDAIVDCERSEVRLGIGPTLKEALRVAS